jgi:hypothetical protein
MTDPSINDSELGRSKKSSTPAEHLAHLLGIGWASSSLLVQKYVAKFGLHNELAQWLKNNENQTQPSKSAQKAAKRS